MTPRRRKLVEDNLDLVGKVAAMLARQIGLPSCVAPDDLVSWGNYGLVDAATRFNRGRGVKFATFAQCRIRGAILDGLRACDPISRSLRKKIHDGLHPNIRILPIHQPLDEKSPEPLHDQIESPREAPEVATADADAADKVFQSIPVEYRNVLWWYFFDHRSLRIIGRRLGVSESRASQRVHQAVTAAREALCPEMVGQPIKMLFHKSHLNG